ncbi:coenzyme F430 synthase [Methanocella arvoryzae]|uniref:UDP-N-acetylmuramoylalanine-D-glutamate ligase n=1 Tax=Methanocella arvoryzae (strain DSM 22066 / NBRC 105507 / MRE50) TaxID=351160 RepID=Q0W383_METAR|nr:coenzyme F430 synthase [Methanocella arvoryzae]CAJ37160.1 putative UDP-N-acetylmuramoylalanine-D-glutamate ligase [Methanocella arvoryzae MRE50]
MELNASRIAILDVNHGGLVLARELQSLGYDTFAVDVYGSGKESEDIRIVQADEAPAFDMLVAPVHMAPYKLLYDAVRRGMPVLTHHRMAGMLIEATGRLKGVKSVEVTGTYGKTTACALLGRMLQAKGEHVLVHASMGLTFDGMPVGERLSITPANMLRALDCAKKAGLHPTACVFEVSLGGCGTADVGIITTLDRDYPVAGGTKRSYMAKMQMIEHAKPRSTIVHQATYRLTGGRDEITFGEGGDLFYGKAGMIEGPLLEGETIYPAFAPGLDLESYGDPALCAAAAALSMGTSPEAVSDALAGFDGIPGRMKRGIIQGRELLDNSCSGLSIDGVLRALEKSGGHPGRKVLVLGEEKYNVCEGLDPAEAARIAEAWAGEVVLVGDRLLSVSGVHAASLKEGLREALSRTAPGDMIISCVKTWR